MSCEPDFQLLERAVAGDRAAVGQLLLEASDELTTYVSRELPRSIAHVVSVEDILQETYRTAFASIGELRSREDRQFMAWLRAIAKNRLLDAVRGQNRKKRGGERRRVPPAGSSDSMLDLLDLVADESTPLRRASRQEALNCMHVALAELPDDHREAIRLRFLEGKSYKEMAEEMQKSEGAVHGLITRAKQKLRELMGRASAYLSSR